MRYALLVLGMLLCVTMAAVAAPVANVHDASYKVALGDEGPGVRVDWEHNAVFIVTQAHGSTLAPRAARLPGGPRRTRCIRRASRSPPVWTTSS